MNYIMPFIILEMTIIYYRNYLIGYNIFLKKSHTILSQTAQKYLKDILITSIPGIKR